jgi:hypothetical protein
MNYETYTTYLIPSYDSTSYDELSFANPADWSLVDEHYQRTIPASSGKETTKWISYGYTNPFSITSEFNDYDFPIKSVSIYTVSINQDANVKTYIVPLLNGVEGSEQLVTGYMFHTTDITDDLISDSTSLVSWTDVKNLSFGYKVYGENTSVVSSKTLDVYLFFWIYIEVYCNRIKVYPETVIDDATAWINIDNINDGSIDTYGEYSEESDSTTPILYFTIPLVDENLYGPIIGVRGYLYGENTNASTTFIATISGEDVGIYITIGNGTYTDYIDIVGYNNPFDTQYCPWLWKDLKKIEFLVYGTNSVGVIKIKEVSIYIYCSIRTIASGWVQAIEV